MNLDTLECFRKHECNERTGCANCDIDFSHILVNPVILSCKHLVCRRCTKGAQNVFCKIHGETTVISALDSDSIEFEISLVNAKLDSYLTKAITLQSSKNTSKNYLLINNFCNYVRDKGRYQAKIQ
jgi:hypothetical protein